jgi:hypothetical protein
MIKKVDVFPAIVYVAEPGSLNDYMELQMKGEKPKGTRRVDRSRAAILDGSLYIAVDAPEGPKLVFRERLLDHARDANGTTHHAITESGKIIAFDKDHNCGCGSRLRSWNPFKSVLASTADPEA